MNKKEIRAWLGTNDKTGDREMEVEQIHLLQAEQNLSEVVTITVCCGSFLTIVCC